MDSGRLSNVRRSLGCTRDDWAIVGDPSTVIGKTQKVESLRRRSDTSNLQAKKRSLSGSFSGSIERFDHQNC